MTSGLINKAIRRPETTIARTRLVILIIILALFITLVNVKSSEKANAEISTVSRYTSFTLQARDQTEFAGDFETTWETLLGNPDRAFKL